MWAGVAIGYHVASRLAYVVGIGTALTRQRHDQVFTRRSGEAAGFRRFRRLAVFLLNNDAVSFVLLSLATRNTLAPIVSGPIRVSLGVLLVIAGLSVKLWAARTLGPGAYYWENFFIPKPVEPLDPPGPYRYIKNPMYTVGYLHAYGFALVCGSALGLAAAAFDQIAILAFHALVEKPHFERLTAETAQPYIAPKP
jgi:protein-S-isoprenylcysteine O-methyltransferase Ste14